MFGSITVRVNPLTPVSRRAIVGKTMIIASWITGNSAPISTKKRGKVWLRFVFMDIHMPEMDGIQATKEILLNNSRPPIIIALTANVMKESEQECYDAGMRHFVHKPFKINELQKVVTSFGK